LSREAFLHAPWKSKGLRPSPYLYAMKIDLINPSILKDITKLSLRKLLSVL
jgi:hypothetical protein